MATATEPIVFLQQVHPNKDLRDASSEAEAILQAYGVQSSMRRDVYDAVQDAASRIRALELVLDPEDQRFVDKLLLQYARDGFNLPNDQRGIVAALKEELGCIQVEFNKNCNEQDGHISFTRDELEGVPAHVIQGYTSHNETGEDLLDVPLKTPDIFPIVSLRSSLSSFTTLMDATSSSSPSVPTYDSSPGNTLNLAL